MGVDAGGALPRAAARPHAGGGCGRVTPWAPGIRATRLRARGGGFRSGPPRPLARGWRGATFAASAKRSGAARGGTVTLCGGLPSIGGARVANTDPRAVRRSDPSTEGPHTPSLPRQSHHSAADRAHAPLHAAPSRTPLTPLRTAFPLPPAVAAMPCIVGLTGGIASGKSTVSRRLAEHHAIPVIDADAIAREVVAPGRPALWLIARTFGRDVLTADGALDRPRLGEMVFGDAAARARLNRITHPFIIGMMAWRLGVALLVRRAPLVVLDTPLLFETRNLLPLCTVTVVVTCSREQQLERLMARSDGTLTEVQAEQRIASQMPLEQKAQMADFVIDNGGAAVDLPEAVDRFVMAVSGNVPTWFGMLFFHPLRAMGER